MKSRVRWWWLLPLTALLLLVAIGAWFWSALRPTPERPPFFIRVAIPTPRERVLSELEERGVVRNAWAAGVWARYRGFPARVAMGTYRVRPGASLDETLRSLASPVRRLVRIPEGRWIAQVAQMLESKQVCSAKEYIAAASDPASFERYVSFPLPNSGTLEGYLFPDTYDLPPLLGAKETIIRQLRTFEKRVGPHLNSRTDLRKAVIIASMVELEAALDRERPLIAGVIANRLAQGRKLEIDATVLYGLGEWRVLGPGEVRKVRSPYNTYLHAGLPPGPIGSPGLRSILAALNPARHDYLYYVAMPDRSHRFAKTYADHLVNIRIARKAARAK